MSSLSLYTKALIKAAGDQSQQGLPSAESLDNYEQAEGINPVCGDRVRWFILRKGDVIEDIRFEVQGCLMNKASASLLAKFVTGKSLQQAEELYTEIKAITVPAQKGDAEFSREQLTQKPWLALAQIRDFPARRKCVMMAWDSFFKDRP